MSPVLHPLTLRERLWLTAHLRTVRGRHVHDGDRLALDGAAAAAAGVDLADGGRVVVHREVHPDDAQNLAAAVQVLERIVRARRREVADPTCAPWTREALRTEEHTLRLLRRVRNAATRATTEDSPA